MPGTLFVVATPIGNLEDFTFRALRTLREVSLIAAEDTRRTSKLLAHYGVSKPLLSLHEHNEYKEAPRLVGRMSAGESIALVSDAGTPGISDPGATLVRLAREAGIRVVPIPGPSAVTAALSVTGLPASDFRFLGFPPPTGRARERWFESIAASHEVCVFFEAPHRINRSVSSLHEYCAGRPIFIHREISKLNEEFVAYSAVAGEVVVVQERGEFVVVVGPASIPAPRETLEGEVLLLFDRLTQLGGLTMDDALVATSAVFSMPLPSVKKAVKKARISLKQRDQSSP